MVTGRLMVDVVIGSMPAAQHGDLAAAQRVADAVDRALAARGSAARARIIGDAQRLGDRGSAHGPCVCIGHPEVNALAAFLLDRVPPAMVIDGELAVQFDAEAPEAVALCWGVSHEATARAAGVFIERFLESFADAAAAECG